MRKLNKLLLTLYFLVVFATVPTYAWAMHIMEGFLPMKWAGFWFLVTAPFVFWGLKSVQEHVKANPKVKLLLGLVGAFAFVLSALKIPSVTGSSSHPTGVGLGAIMFGPTVMTVLGVIILIFQAVLLAHGGLTTLGANTFSMGVVGPLLSFGIYKLTKKVGAPLWLAVFLSATLGDLATYVTTSLQLGLAFPASVGGVLASTVKFLSIFAVTQLPLAISEGVLTVLVFNTLMAYNKDELQELAVISGGVHSESI